MIVDFDDIGRLVRAEIVSVLDHQSLNDFIDNPTSERIVLWIWERLDGVLAGLDELTLWETRSSCAVLRRSDFH